MSTQPIPDRPEKFGLSGSKHPGRRVFTTSRGWTIFLFLLPAVVLVIWFTYYPIFTGMQIAFRHWNTSDLTDTSWIGLQNFKEVLSGIIGIDFWGLVRNSAIWVLGSLVPQVVIGFALALAMKRKFRGRGAYQAFVFFPWAVSGFLIGLVFRWMFNAEYGVVNDLLIQLHIIDSAHRVQWLADPALAMVSVIVANVWYGVTFFGIMILAALQSVPEELYEASSLDGAGRARRFFYITVPSIRGTLSLIILLRVIWIFNSADLIWGMTGGGPAGATDIITSYMVKTTLGGNLGRAGALGILILIFLLLFALFYLMAAREKKS